MLLSSKESAEAGRVGETSRETIVADPATESELPLLLTPEQLAALVFQIEYDEKHVTHLRRHGGLPYVQFQLNGCRIFRYPREAVIQWLISRTHGLLQTMATHSSRNSTSSERTRRGLSR